MAKKRIIRYALLLAGLLAIAATACSAQPRQTDRIGVVVSILPQAGFVEKVGGDRVEVTVMIPPGASPHTYEPKPSQLAALSRAGMYAAVGSGIEFELAWMDKLRDINPDMLVVDCSRGVELRAMTEEEAAAEEEEHEGEHGMMDPHIWTSPVNAQAMVRNICDGLVEVDPGNRSYYESNRDAYLQELTRLDTEIRERLSGLNNRTIMVYHPAFGYFAREYNLTMLLVEKEGKEPTPAGLTRLIEQAKEHNIKVVFAEPQFNPRSAEVIAGAIDGRVIFVDPLLKDYIENLRTIAGQIAGAMD
jgi:zinc transport system substrate-binding protein